MKKLSLYLVGIFCLANCTSKTETKKETEQTEVIDEQVSTANADGTVCYIRTEGTKNQDTTYVQLTKSGTDVSGKLNWLPYEKDSRVGTLKATSQGNIIRGVWRYMQEGMRDSLEVAFKVEGDNLYQIRHSVDRNTGREILTDTANYSIQYKKAACK